jgi:1,4-alpha-glucan branching enzyme
MGWMHDTLDYTGRDPIHRSYHHNQMTFSLMYAFSENYVLPISHDEVVHGKGSLWTRMPGDDWNKAAGVRALLAYMWAHPGKQLLFMGGEFGQPREWSEQRSLDWHLQSDDPLHGGITTLVGDLNRTYRAQSALWSRDTTPDGFGWIDANDAQGNVFSFLRHGVDAEGRATVLACVANFSGSPREDYRVGLPFAGNWTEVVNTDASAYGGSGVGNLGRVRGEQVMWHGQPASAVLRLPPSGVLWLVPEETGGPVLSAPAQEAAPAATVPPPLPAAALPDEPEDTDVEAPVTPDDDLRVSAAPADPADLVDPGPDDSGDVPDAGQVSTSVAPAPGTVGVRAVRTGTFVNGSSGTGASDTGTTAGD